MQHQNIQKKSYHTLIIVSLTRYKWKIVRQARVSRIIMCNIQSYKNLQPYTDIFRTVVNHTCFFIIHISKYNYNFSHQYVMEADDYNNVTYVQKGTFIINFYYTCMDILRPKKTANARWSACQTINTIILRESPVYMIIHDLFARMKLNIASYCDMWSNALRFKP